MMTDGANMKKHIVIALGDYYPTPSANGICVDKIVETFVEQGFFVDIVANNTDGIKGQVKTENKAIHFVELPLIQRINKRLKRENTPVIKAALLIVKKVLALRLPLLKLIYPVTSRERCRVYEKRIRAVTGENDVVAIIGVHKPMEAIYGAYRAAAMTDIPFFCYFLDPLVGGYHNRLINERVIAENTENYEKELISASMKTIYMSSHYSNVVHRYKNGVKDKLVFLGPPLLKEYNYSKERINNADKKVVVYAGSVYEDIRNPQYIMQVFKNVKKARLEMFIPEPEEWVYQYENENIEIHDGISHAEMVEKLEDADVLLNIGNSTAVFIPSKIIEYISMKKPIISTDRIDEDPCRLYMETYPNSLSIDERRLGIEEAAKEVDRFVMQRPISITFDDLKDCFYINTPEAFVETVVNCIV